MKLKVPLALICCLCLGITCKKQPKTCNGLIPLHPMAYDYFVYKPGSYWIYQEEKTGELDSAWIDYYNDLDHWPYKMLGTKDCPCFKQITIVYRHSAFKSLRETQHPSAIISMQNKTNVSELVLTGIYDSMVLEERRFYGIADTGSFSKTTASWAGSVNMLESFANNATYKKVFHLKYPRYLPTYDWLVELYQAPHVGMVCFTDSKYRVWNLIRYKAIQ